jgi:hypothetical protein
LGQYVYLQCNITGFVGGRNQTHALALDLM